MPAATVGSAVHTHVTAAPRALVPPCGSTAPAGASLPGGARPPASARRRRGHGAGAGHLGAGAGGAEARTQRVAELWSGTGRRPRWRSPGRPASTTPATCGAARAGASAHAHRSGRVPAGSRLAVAAGLHDEPRVAGRAARVQLHSEPRVGAGVGAGARVGATV